MMNLMRISIVGLMLALQSLSSSAAEPIKLHPLFTDNMVLQRGKPCPVWGTANPGEEIYVQITIQTPDGKKEEGQRTKADDKGKWMVKLSALDQGINGELTVKPASGKSIVLKNIAMGEVWICSGQSNMEWSLRNSTGAEEAIKTANFPDIRLFTVDKFASLKPLESINKPNHWLVCKPENVPAFSGVGFFFGRALHQAKKVPIGLIHTSWGGTPAEAWTSREALLAQSDLAYYVNRLDEQIKKFDPEQAKKKNAEMLAKWKTAVEKAKKEGKKAPGRPRLLETPGVGAHQPSALYNAMIAPLVPFAIKGAIWYQGESNAGRAYEYRNLFATMINDWRHQWGEDFPFMLVQLAPFASGGKRDGLDWPELREAQTLATKKLKNVGMAVITDVGEEKDIHPRKKMPVGERLALAARAIAYGDKIEFSGPLYESMKTEDNKLMLTFSHADGGLVVKGEKATGFAIAGEDQKFYPAEAVIQGNQVILSSPMVPKPIAARFGWANYPVVNLFNKSDLPACPFRTDDFPMVTKPKSPAKRK